MTSNSALRSSCPRLSRTCVPCKLVTITRGVDGTSAATTGGAVYVKCCSRPHGDPGADRELGAVARCPNVGSLRYRLAQGWADVGDVVPAFPRGIHPGESGRLRSRRTYHAHARRHEH